MSLPDRASIDPKDTLKCASVVWAHSEFVTCPTCRQPALTGYLDHRLVGIACHKCGPIDMPTLKSPPK